MKKIKSVGRELSKNEQKKVIGAVAGGTCTYSWEGASCTSSSGNCQTLYCVGASGNKKTLGVCCDGIQYAAPGEYCGVNATRCCDV